MSAHMLSEQICAVVLAGGRGMRMGGVDKGLQLFQGEALVACALRRLRQQLPLAPGGLAISANRNLSDYAGFGVPVWRDTIADFAGPLAGMLSAMEHCAGRFTYLLTVPCDSPRMPLDLLNRLATALLTSQAELAMACAPEPSDIARADEAPVVLRRQPVFCLLRVRLAPSLATFLQSGGRKIDTWCSAQTMVLVPFDTPADAVQAFANANTLQELQALERP